MVPIEKGITSHTSVYKKNITRNNLKGRNYNSFAPLQSYNTEYYKCGNQYHISKKCRLVIYMDDISKSQTKKRGRLGRRRMMWNVH